MGSLRVTTESDHLQFCEPAFEEVDGDGADFFGADAVGLVGVEFDFEVFLESD